jgi:uncharacterized protein (TIGR03083 family)
MAYEYVIEALSTTWNSVSKVLENRPESDFARMTPCPGWDVKDVLSHLVGFEKHLQDPQPVTLAGAPAPHVQNELGRLNEAHVAARRELPGAAVLEEFEAVTRVSIENLKKLPPEGWEVVGWSPEGDRPLHRFMETRVVDSWIHLQDIRDALLEPDDDHGPGEEIVVNRFEAALPYIIGKKSGLLEGQSARLNLTGRLARTTSLEIVNARAIVRPVLELPSVEITTPVALFWRRCAGRISAEAFLSASATDVRGDASLAQRIAGQMVVMI